MNDDEARIANLIREVFAGAQLCSGVGLMQGQGLDDYADDETSARYRAQDEEEDWSRIAVEDLNRCHSSLSFFDAEGMRFHLPAYLVAHLEGTLTQDVLFHLTQLTDYGMARYFALTSTQRDAVREFLLLELSRSNDFTRPMIEQALSEYWVQSTSK